MCWQLFDVANERHADALRRAEQAYLVHMAMENRAARTSARGRYRHKALLVLGAWLISAGTSLQSRASSAEMMARKQREYQAA